MFLIPSIEELLRRIKMLEFPICNQLKICISHMCAGGATWSQSFTWFRIDFTFSICLICSDDKTRVKTRIIPLYCLGFFCLGVPEIIYTNYQEDQLHDVLVLENLVAAGNIHHQTLETKFIQFSNHMFNLPNQNLFH